MTADRIVLTIPRAQGFEDVAQLVLAGVAARLNFTYEVVDDLGTALATLLERRGDDGDLTVELDVAEDTVTAVLGPQVECHMRKAAGVAGLARGDHGLRGAARALGIGSDRVDPEPQRDADRVRPRV